ncbi:D-glycero-beta-D-manno-heptose 1,7-bisphosphate 7-phosphatase [Actinobacillus equuli subsp. haemolyticus]|uniref:D-glycero-beta-D-manno-heptose 1,7-bisphosphate 7-phosphatase n=1 Tax=Actinobacillus equuli TaxID=718 RepID=UPI00244114BB|nr:D-glycero-beta-D-manno-heptose 1,7-bisphosphate 7-phosphatase [Actinobacillus equuli]WGE54031.1 D-glycero-beta-D-manno-heptose 1,7-bisphosphate 7-phosphatase [Actinobacillus equuli subsp. haemolyticus]WGE64283.1 D-glycero-beta-D-manno-heptose 1,7-bisphosphate 7-phosphatase [Actinobacillus equuli subsp. haemolyticus]WGE66403.1 D-glycero-beta-D-manno-heptose 1,7-bisphosphate 7-phosphatase [Actinobacillus equuli subsp. equuli]WGE70299.1 D-glycero-beta-D-manno-heptose 1,7-bisphosphate 7-phosphat
MANKAIFLDRDGTINIDHGYVHQIDDFQFIEGVGKALKQLQDKGYLLVLVTNQSGIARGYFSEEQFNQLTEWMDWSLDEDYGVVLDGIYYCPHHPEGKGEYKEDCDCRKPKAGMFTQAIADLNIDPTQSYMVGDKLEDLLAAEAAGVKTKVLVRTGKPVTAEGEAKADLVLDSLVDLVRYIK